MNNIFKKIKSDERGVAIIMITLLIMASILTAALSLGSVVINGLRTSNTQQNATQAYFAAESAAERILWETRKNGFDPKTSGCDSGQYIRRNFAPPPPPTCQDNPNGQALTTKTVDGSPLDFYIMYEYEQDLEPTISSTTFSNFGEYRGTRRAVRLIY